MQITTYQPKYQTLIVDLILQIQREEFGLPITLEDQPDLLNIPTVYQQGNGNFWVALDSSQVIGTIAAIDIGNHQLAMRKMFVAAAYRGQSIGVGKQLLDALYSWATERKICEIYLGTVEAFKAAHRFYEKHGFRRLDKFDLPAAFPMMQGDTRFYRLIISKFGKLRYKQTHQ